MSTIEVLSTMERFREALKNNSLSIVLFSLFIAFLVAQSLTGYLSFNAQLTSHGLSEIDYREFLASGTFLNGIFANWQAAILQLATLIISGVFLVQRGATHSRKHLEPDPEEPTPANGFGKAASWLYRNSLFIAFLALFLATFLLHLFSGTASFNEQRMLSRQPPLSAAEFFTSASFWFSTLQTWQAEFLAIGVYMILSIFLRQKGSPESKPVESSNESTGESETG